MTIKEYLLENPKALETLLSREVSLRMHPKWMYLRTALMILAVICVGWTFAGTIYLFGDWTADKMFPTNMIGIIGVFIFWGGVLFFPFRRAVRKEIAAHNKIVDEILEEWELDK